MTDTGLKQIAKCHRLRYLRIMESVVTEIGICALADLDNLEILELHVPVDDNAFEHLTKLQNLTSLRIDSSKLTDETLFNVTKLSKLKSLELNGDGFTGNGLVHLRNLKSLERLGVGGWKFSNQAADHLAELTQLKMLMVWSRGLSNEDVNKLSNLSELKYLSFSDDVSSAAVTQLRKALPHCEVFGGDSYPR